MASPPVIDAHQHVWDPARHEAPWPGMDEPPLRKPYGPDELRPELASEGVTGTILVASVDSLEETARLLALASEEELVRGVVGSIDLGAGTVETDIAVLRRRTGGDGLVGLSLRVHDEADIRGIKQKALRDALVAVADAGLVVDLDVRPAAMAAVLELCRGHPQVHFVLDHLGRPPIASGDLSAWGGALLPLADLPNVSAKVSGLVIEADWHTWSIDDLRHPVELAVDAFGPARLMLGSAWPACLVAGSYADVMDSVRYLTAELPTIAQDEIRGGTAVRVYRLARSVPEKGSG